MRQTGKTPWTLIGTVCGGMFAVLQPTVGNSSDPAYAAADWFQLTSGCIVGAIVGLIFDLIINARS